MSALARLLDAYVDTYLASGQVYGEELTALAAGLGATYQVRRGVHVLSRGGRVVLAATAAPPSRQTRTLLSQIPCASCGSLPVGSFPSGRTGDDRRRYACGPHEPIRPQVAP
jgi:hypothetical protein